MSYPDVPPTRLRTAIALSIAAHLCALWFLAIQLGNRDLGAGTLDDPPAFRVTTIVRREVPQPRAVAITRVAGILRPASAKPLTPRPVPRPAVHARPRVRPQVVAAPSHAKPAGGRTEPARRATAAPRRFTLAISTPPSAAASTPTPLPSPSASPPMPSATALPTPPTVAAANFGGLFSQNYPPALAAPSDLAALRSRLAGRVRIRVDVDETGRATGVRFVGPVADDDFAQKVRSELLALHYVPADCNGLHCEGTLEINF